jgi:hypothetical protein
MGKYFLDQYSVLHFISGMIAYLLGVPFVIWIMVHICFEILENMRDGRYIITNYLTFWPGGKKSTDSFLNSMGDNLCAMLGWVFLYLLDE